MMKRNILFLLVCFLSVTAWGQHGHRHSATNFDFTFKGGINLCQVDGDSDGGFNKVGYNAGINTTFPLGDPDNGWRMLVGISLTNKGSVVSNLNRNISLTYVEVPLLLTYNFGEYDERGLRVGVGIAPAILAKASVKDNNVDNIHQSENFKKIDAVPVCIDVQYRFNSHWGVNLDYYNSMLSVTKENGEGTYRIFRSNKGAFNRLVSIGVSFRM